MGTNHLRAISGVKRACQRLSRPVGLTLSSTRYILKQTTDSGHSNWSIFNIHEGPSGGICGWPASMSGLILFLVLVCSLCDIGTCTSGTLVLARLTIRAVFAVLDVLSEHLVRLMTFQPKPLVISSFNDVLWYTTNNHRCFKRNQLTLRPVMHVRQRY